MKAFGVAILHLMAMVTDFGRPRANTATYAKNNLELEDYEAVTTPGRDVITKGTAAALSVSSVVFAGTTYTAGPGEALPATNPDAIFDWLMARITKFEIDPYLTVVYDSGTLTVTHMGHYTLTSITFDDASTANGTRTTTTVVNCTYGFSVDGDPGNFTDGTFTPAALANAPYAFTGVVAADEATRAQLETDIIAKLDLESTPYVSVNVYTNQITGAFDIEIVAEQGVSSFSLGTVPFIESKCKTMFG